MYSQFYDPLNYYDVILVSCSDDRVKMMKKLRELSNFKISIYDAKTIVNNLPYIIARSINDETKEKIAKHFNDINVKIVFQLYTKPVLMHGSKYRIKKG